MRTRILLACGLAVGAVLFWHVTPGAQDAKPEAASITREYDVDHLLHEQPSQDMGTAELDIWRLKGERADGESPQWHLNGYLAQPEINLSAILGALDRFSEADDWEITPSPGRKLLLTAPAEFHQRVSAVLDWLTAMRRARVKIEVLRLDAAPGKTILSAQEASSAPKHLVGMQHVIHGGRAVFSDVQQKTLTWGTNVSYAGGMPQASDLAWGRQWQVGAMLLPEGRIQLTGWAAVADLQGVRRLATPEGVIELPAINYRYASVSGSIESGGGLVCDAGPDGQFLFRASCEVRLDHLTFGDGAFTLWHPAGVLKPGDLDGGWFLRDAPARNWGESRALPQLEPGRARIVYPGSPHDLAVKHLVDSLDSRAPFDAAVVIDTCNPLLVVSQDRSQSERYVQPRADLTASLKRATAGADHAAFRVAMLLLPPDARLPVGVAGGKPETADVEAAFKLGKLLADRRVRLAVGQTAGFCSLGMRNYVSMYWASSAAGLEGIKEANVETFADGWQVSVQPGDEESVVARVGFVPAALWRTLELEQEFAGLKVQRPETALAEVRFDDSLPKGAWLSGLNSLPDGRRLLVFIGREE